METQQIQGIVKRVHTVGYRSPWRLEAEDNSFELRGLEDELEARQDQQVKLRGVFVEVPAEQAEEGSEAASRFVTGQIPAQRWFEVQELLAG